jgi:8-oxoguanine deaminase
MHDPVAALVFCTPSNIAYSVINGRIVVRKGHFTTVDLPIVREKHNQLALKLAHAAH